MDRHQFYFISNDCTTTRIYPSLNRPYDTPFIASLFEDDMQYLKFCLNFEHYMSLTPRFEPPILPVHAADPQVPLEKVVTMFLGDIEIHWIHHSDPDEVREDYYRRLERGQGKLPFFIWSDSTLYQPHPPEEREYLISQFLSLPENQRVYFRKENIPKWADQSFDDQNYTVGHVIPLKWNDMHLVAEMVLQMLD